MKKNKKAMEIKYLIFKVRNVRFKKNGPRQYFHLSKFQHNTRESPTSHPRINKGDL
jgi:hypothetical protein